MFADSLQRLIKRVGMTEKENLLKTVRFERPDHIPMTFHVNASCWNHYPQEELLDLMEAHPLLFPGFKRPSLPVVPEFPAFARKDSPFTCPWGCVYETSEDGIVGTVTRHPLASWDAFETYRAPDPFRTTHWGPVDWETLSVTKGSVGFITCMPSAEIGHGHTFLKLIDIRGYENTLFDMEDGDPRLNRLIGMLEEFNLGLVENYIRYARVEWMGFAEDLGMQIGPMLSPGQFRTYIKPSYRRMMDRARKAGCVIHMHSDGDIRSLIGDLIDDGVEVLNLQDQVNGIPWIRDHLKGRLCIDLDIDRQGITFLGTPKDVDAMVRTEVEELGSPSGGLMMIYGLYPGVPLENARALMDAMERYTDFHRT
jgi:uroporphyrinogen decarboxylase